MSRAVNACKRGEMSIRQASQAYNVPNATLGTKFKLNKGADTAVAAKLGKKLVLGECFFVFQSYGNELLTLKLKDIGAFGLCVSKRA